MSKLKNTECTTIRDPKTPDLFHSLTESDIAAIAVKLSDDPKGRFKEHLSEKFVQEFIVLLSNIKPELIAKLQRYKNRKIKKAA